MPHQIIWSWYTGRWWVGCYIWYGEEGTGQDHSPPRPLLTVPNVPAHPSTASVPTTVLLYNGPLLCGLKTRLKTCHCLLHFLLLIFVNLKANTFLLLICIVPCSATAFSWLNTWWCIKSGSCLQRVYHAPTENFYNVSIVHKTLIKMSFTMSTLHCRFIEVSMKKCMPLHFLSASLYFSKRGAYWDRLCRDVVGWLSHACTVAKRCILGL